MRKEDRQGTKLMLRGLGVQGDGGKLRQTCRQADTQTGRAISRQIGKDEVFGFRGPAAQYSVEKN